MFMYDSYGVELFNFGFCEIIDFEMFMLIGCFNEGVMKMVNIVLFKYGVVIYFIVVEVCCFVDYWKFGLF